MLFICMLVGCKRGLADSFAPFARFGKSPRALDLHVLNDVVVVLLTHPLPQQGFGKGPGVCMVE